MIKTLQKQKKLYISYLKFMKILKNLRKNYKYLTVKFLVNIGRKKLFFFHWITNILYIKLKCSKIY